MCRVCVGCYLCIVHLCVDNCFVYFVVVCVCVCVCSCVDGYVCVCVYILLLLHVLLVLLKYGCICRCVVSMNTYVLCYMCVVMCCVVVVCVHVLCIFNTYMSKHITMYCCVFDLLLCCVLWI